MTPLRRAVVIALILFGFSTAPQAQTSGYYGGSNAYQFGGSPGNFGYGYNGRVNVFNVNAAAGNSMNFLGCGGIGIFNFTKLTFNMNNVIDQLKQSMQTMLAKQLLTTAMSIPQVSAIFDTLNAFGNARFDLFNQSCNLNSIKRDARQAVINKCVQDGGSPVDCQNNWDSQANAGKWISSALKNLCGYDNFNQSVRKPACSNEDGSASSACSLMAFMPQYRLSVAGGAGGSGGGAFCSGGASGPNVRQPVFVLQSSVDAIRGVSGVYTGKASSAVAEARNQGVSDATLKLAINAAQDKCSRDRANCGKSGGSSVAAAQPGRVLLAKVDLKQLGFADDASEASDAQLERFKKFIGCGDKPDPMALLKEVNLQLQQIQPGASLGDLTVSEADAKNITDSLNFAIGGDEAAARQLGLDAKAAARLLQTATECIMSGAIPAIDPNILREQIYNQDPNCTEAWKNGSGVWVSHLAVNYLYKFLKTEAKGLEAAIISGKAVSTDKANDGQIVEQTDAEETPEDIRNKQLTTIRAAQTFFEDQLSAEESKYGTVKDMVERIRLPGACSPRTPQPVEMVIPDDDY